MRETNRHELALVIAAVAGSVMTNIIVNGLSDVVRYLIFALMLCGFSVSLWILASGGPYGPAWLHGRKWAKREVDELRSDPDHPLHADFWSENDKNKYRHARAVERARLLQARGFGMREWWTTWRKIRANGSR